MWAEDYRSSKGGFGSHRASEIRAIVQVLARSAVNESCAERLALHVIEYRQDAPRHELHHGQDEAWTQGNSLLA